MVAASSSDFPNLWGPIKQLEAFNDYIETDDLVLVAESGKRLPILCPILRHGGEIVWRWNPSDNSS